MMYEGSRVTEKNFVKGWYCIYTGGNKEECVSDSLKTKGFRTEVPRGETEVFQWSRFRLLRRMRPLFTGYVFVWVPDYENYVDLCDHPGVHYIAGYSSARQNLYPEDLHRFYVRVAEERSRSLLIGNEVKVRKDFFQNLGKGQGLEGVITKKNKARVWVEAPLFERQVLIELFVWDVEPK